MGQSILVTAARSPVCLDLCRLLSTCGHTVYAAETSRFHLCRPSCHVKQSFVVPSPRFDPDGFANGLLQIINGVGIDLVIPTFEETIYISKLLDLFPKQCRIFTSPFELIHTLHNKHSFIRRLQELGLPAPETRLIRSYEELTSLQIPTPYVLKHCYSRAAQSIHVVQPGEALPDLNWDPLNPWVAQDFVNGKKWCTYSICSEGRLQAHSTYPVVFGIDGISCVSFEAVHHSGLIEWVQKWAALEGYTGQVGFDFIETEEGILYPIECNPRATAGLHLFTPEDGIENAFFTPQSSPILPKEGRERQLAFGMFMYGWRQGSSEESFSSFLRHFLTSKDVVFSLSDPMPFLMQFFLMGTLLQQRRRLKLPLPALFNHDLEWNGSAAVPFTAEECC